MAIKAIIFDLGGILLNINYQATIDAFKRLGGKDFPMLFNQAAQAPLFDRLETGDIEIKPFYRELKSTLGIDASDSEITDAWNAMLLDIPITRIEQLEKLRNKNLKIYLFSNNNAIHYQKLLEIYERDIGLFLFNNSFDFQYYSHLYKQRKPNIEAFQNITHEIYLEHAIKPREILFIDDTIRHVHGAESAGLHALYMPSNLPQEQFTETLQQKLIAVDHEPIAN